MKTKRLLYLSALYCILALLTACKDESNAPLRFYDSQYEVPMGGRRYLGLQSGNGDYSVEIKDTRVAGAGIETGWTGVPAGCQIYVTGILTGTTQLKVTDYATNESCILPIKVVDNYEDINLSRSSFTGLPNLDVNLLSGIDDVFLINNQARDAYFFKQGEQTALSSGLELITKGSYTLEKEAGSTTSATLTLSFAENSTTPVSEHRFILWGNSYLLHRLDKNLSLNWGTTPVEETRTSPESLPQWALEEIKEGVEAGKGKQISFSLNYKEIPFGILP